MLSDRVTFLLAVAAGAFTVAAVSILVIVF
jgi:hypothetical protein